MVNPIVGGRLDSGASCESFRCPAADDTGGLVPSDRQARQTSCNAVLFA
jgi:hypothetical protein